MEKAAEIGKVTATGGYHLFLGKTASTVILAVGTLVLGALILEEDYGLYAIAMIPATTMLLFQDWGVGSAVIRRCAQCRTASDSENARKTIIVGMMFALLTGIVLTLLSVVTANSIAINLFDKPESSFLITFASINILFMALFNMTQSIFVGFEKMRLVSLISVCYAIVQSFVAPLLVYLGYGAFGALIGYTVGYAVAASFSTLLLYFAIFKKLRRVSTNRLTKFTIIETLKPLLNYGIPLGFGVILSGILTPLYSFAMASYCDPVMIGNYKIATNFALLLALFAFPISTVLFPAFSKLDPENEQPLLKTVFASSIKYSTLLIVPATIAFILLSKPMVGTLYGSKWQYAPQFLAISVIGNLLVVFGSLSVTNLLNALGKTKWVMILNIITLAIGIPLAFILVPWLGITGLIIGILVAGTPSVFIGLGAVCKRYGTRIDLNSSARILFSSAVAAVPTYILLTILNTPNWIQLLTGTLLFLTIFLLAAPLTGAVTRTDINNLRAMLSGLGIISRMLEIPLTTIQKLTDVRSNPEKPSPQTTH